MSSFSLKSLHLPLIVTLSATVLLLVSAHAHAESSVRISSCTIPGWIPSGDGSFHLPAEVQELPEMLSVSCFVMNSRNESLRGTLRLVEKETGKTYGEQEVTIVPSVSSVTISLISLLVSGNYEFAVSVMGENGEGYGEEYPMSVVVAEYPAEVLASRAQEILPTTQSNNTEGVLVPLLVTLVSLTLLAFIVRRARQEYLSSRGKEENKVEDQSQDTPLQS